MQKLVAMLLASFALALALALPATASAQDDDYVARLWPEARQYLEPEGVTLTMFRSASLWMELQGMMGACTRQS